jgi:serine/threonine-protein kinase HipA
MSRFSPVRKLDVYRRLSSGQRVKVGTLAQNARAVFFQYDSDYVRSFANLSPFALKFDSSLQQAPDAPHGGLHGVFADSLPDGWGLLLMDRVFRQHGVLPQQLTAMDRLAYVGSRGMGALEYWPISEYSPASGAGQVNMAELGVQAQALFDGRTTEVLGQLAQVGSSAGARPKAQVYLQPQDLQQGSTTEQQGLEPWLVKFTSSTLALGHEEGLCEAAYLTLAQHAGIDIPEWQLIPAPASSGAQAWLALKRFDCTQAGGRYHLHSLGGLLDADFRMPSMDYEDLIKASSLLCKSPAAGQAQFRRAVFNLLALNQDDHTKNWAFIQDDKGAWQPAPFYDVTFSPNPQGEHSTAFCGYGKSPSLKAMQQLAKQASFASWQDAQDILREVAEMLTGWDQVSRELGVSKENRRLIADQLYTVRQQNCHLLDPRNGS